MSGAWLPRPLPLDTYHLQMPYACVGVASLPALPFSCALYSIPPHHLPCTMPTSPSVACLQIPCLPFLPSLFSSLNHVSSLSLPSSVCQSLTKQTSHMLCLVMACVPGHQAVGVVTWRGRRSLLTMCALCLCLTMPSIPNHYYYIFYISYYSPGSNSVFAYYSLLPNLCLH